MNGQSNDSPKRYHLTGIGGAGMCGLAHILLQQGCRVSGSDPHESASVQALTRAGVPVTTVQDGRSIPAQTDVVVASLAVHEANAELAEARHRGIEVVRYPEAIARLMAGKRGLCVAGTHGKTTVTAALAFCLESCGADPTFVVGGSVPQLGSSARHGRSEWFVLEACEYQRAFLAYRPYGAIVTNVEREHMDYYRDEADLVEAFASFVAGVDPEGAVLVCGQSPGAVRAAEKSGRAFETYAVDVDADWVACMTRGSASPRVQRFCLQHHGVDMGHFQICLPGLHNAANSTAAIAMTQRIGMDLEAVRSAIESFHGAERRFDVVAECQEVTVIDDFAHHPTELRLLLGTARGEYPGRRLVCVFQPHQYSRTRFFLDEFADVLGLADLAIVAPIYEARDCEDDRSAVSASAVAGEAAARGGRVHAAQSLEEIEDMLAAELRPGDVLLTVGAGDVWKIAKRMVRRLEGDRAV